MILTQWLDPFKHYKPSIFEWVGLWFNLASNIISDILKHTYGNQVVVYVILFIAGVEMDRIENCSEIGQRQFANVIAYNQF
jgi:hypothetical protein